MLTDLRLVVVGGDGAVAEEVALDDIAGLAMRLRPIGRMLGRRDVEISRASTGSARPERVEGRPPAVRVEPPVVLRSLSRRQVLALVLHLVGRQTIDLTLDAALVEDSVRLAGPSRSPHAVLTAAAGALAVALLAIRLQGDAMPIAYSPGDPIYPDGVKRDREAIVRFMEREVMPWARATLSPVVGGASRVTCATCHGHDGEATGWKMPAVAELPYPKVRTGGPGTAERYAWPSADPQLRNAVYADLAQEDRQATAAYMRQVVMPGMARLLDRPAYDFARSYRYNRTRFAFGCYHCHKVS